MAFVAPGAGLKMVEVFWVIPDPAEPRVGCGLSRFAQRNARWFEYGSWRHAETSCYYCFAFLLFVCVCVCVFLQFVELVMVHVESGVFLHTLERGRRFFTNLHLAMRYYSFLPVRIGSRT